jgi:CheY-like chemotaxis protein
MNAQLKNILLVEDDPRDVELTLAALDEHKLANKVTVARDGEEHWIISITEENLSRARMAIPSS